ncbi:methionine--tRNA ligase [Sedimentibacter hydroxybenzoicus DSM 7310]|uniref:Methionine--tRNA ligase n=1 Tax=Sedimentibacter hydroxybenzoicus DSM 7310 TaxID=1123245 RepID=A0A974BLZ4_SEDHY|nr:methionine--tRNA ligase [Sedimentibacter hydroxybenzoicus]NYB75271.1 methionine--tRNA ligase [Sedimentibacter hydroxybenzoicus DSM 7310]
MKILVGSAWPYANGSLHVGHLAGLLSSDIIARYHRLKGDDVYFVSGSDCFGTPVAIRAKQENRTPKEISDFYHDEFCECFQKLGFSYDLYGKTSSEEHQSFVREFHEKMYESPYIYEKSVPQAYCQECKTFLADRFVKGACPSCGKNARGDQCDACGKVLEPEALINPTCSVCGSTPIFKETKHLFISISKLEDKLKAYVNSHSNWRKNATAFSNRYINEGLRDRAITRDLDWGIDVPKEGYEDKKIYIWAENVLGYLSQSFEVCKNRNTSFEELWGENAKHYYVHGKDNIPFHTIILPSLLFANGGNWHLPDEIVSSEYLTLEGRKISTSNNWAIWVKDIVNKYNPDSLRYFFIANGPEKRDADFSWLEYLNNHNSELLGAYGNFVNRNFVFIEKYFESKVPNGTITSDISQKISEAFESIGNKIENTNLRDALDEIFELVRYGNKYFDTEKPWETRKGDVTSCENTIFNCVQLIANLAVLLSPFIPFSSEKVTDWLNLKYEWKLQSIDNEYILPKTEILFERLDKSIVEDELNKLIK